MCKVQALSTYPYFDHGWEVGTHTSVTFVMILQVKHLLWLIASSWSLSSPVLTPGQGFVVYEPTLLPCSLVLLNKGIEILWRPPGYFLYRIIRSSFHSARSRNFKAGNEFDNWVGQAMALQSLGSLFSREPYMHDFASQWATKFCYQLYITHKPLVVEIYHPPLG